MSGRRRTPLIARHDHSEHHVRVAGGTHGRISSLRAQLLCHGVLPPEAARIRAGLDGLTTVTTSRSVAEAEVVLSEGWNGLFVVGLYPHYTELEVDSLSGLVARFSSVSSIVYCCGLNSRTAHAIEKLVRAGAGALVVLGTDDSPGTWRRLLVESQTRSFSERVMTAIATALPPSIRPIIAECLKHASQPMTVSQLARGLNMNRRSLVSRTAKAGWLPPHVLIGWCRVLLASYLLEDPARSVTDVAAHLQFSSPSGLRNAFKRYAGSRAGALRLSGGFGETLRRFSDVAVRADGVRASHNA
jgi:AraC-like DNA-binding protein